MKTNVLKIRNLVPVFLTLFVFLSIYLLLNQQQLRTSISDEKVKSEKLLSEKLKLEKTVDDFQKNLASLKGRNLELDKLIADANQKLISKAREIERLISENATIPVLKQKNTELEALKNQLTDKISLQNETIAQLQSENNKLNEELLLANNSIRKMEHDQALLTALASDKYRTEALKGKKDKLTVNARRSDKLLVSFDIPSNIGTDIYFTVKTPDGKKYSSNKDLAANMKIIDNNDDLIAGNGDFAGTNGTKRVEMSFNTAEKLKKGIYEFNMYSNGEYLGSSQLRLK